MIFDKNRYRIAEMRSMLKKGTGDPDALRRKIAEYESREPDWYVGWYDEFGKYRNEKVPDCRSRRDAERYERKLLGAKDEGRPVSGPSKRKAKIRIVTQQYLEAKEREVAAKKKKLAAISDPIMARELGDDIRRAMSSFGSAKTLVKHISRHLGNVPLERLAEDKGFLKRFFEDFPEKEWSEKYVWNYAITLKAAISTWYEANGITSLNPMRYVTKSVIRPGTRKRENVPTSEQYEHVLKTALEYGNGPESAAKGEVPFPDFIPWLLIARWETGLRIGEIIAWVWEEIELEFANGRLPYFTTTITKQKRKVKKQIPMTYHLWRMLKSIPGQHERGPVFKSQKTGEPLLNPPTKQFARLRKVAGVNFFFHDFRKSKKTALTAQGFSRKQTKDIQGHATDSMDDYYTCLQREQLEPMVIDSWQEHLSESKPKEEKKNSEDAVADEAGLESMEPDQLEGLVREIVKNTFQALSKKKAAIPNLKKMPFSDQNRRLLVAGAGFEPATFGL